MAARVGCLRYDHVRSVNLLYSLVQRDSEALREFAVFPVTAHRGLLV
jgi:hypothetical protein